MAQQSSHPDLISLKDAAARLNISYREVYNLAFTGQVGFERLSGGQLMLLRADIETRAQAATASSPPLLPASADGNRVLQGRYEIVETIKAGGYGTVQKARHRPLDKWVAIKKARPDDPAFRQALEHEAKLLANRDLRHDNLPVVLDAFTEGNDVFLVMDFIDGVNLEQWMDQNGPASEATALDWADTLLTTLAFLHGQNPPVIHRDIKPNNIIVEAETQKLYLVDFGLAKQHDRSIGGRTPYFASPEHDSGGTDARSDIYSLGATLYYLLSKHRPPDVKKRHAGEPLVPLNEFAESRHVSSEMWQVISKAMALSPTKRWTSADEMLDALSDTKTQKTL